MSTTSTSTSGLRKKNSSGIQVASNDPRLRTQLGEVNTGPKSQAGNALDLVRGRCRWASFNTPAVISATRKVTGYVLNGRAPKIDLPAVIDPEDEIADRFAEWAETADRDGRSFIEALNAIEADRMAAGEMFVRINRPRNLDREIGFTLLESEFVPSYETAAATRSPNSEVVDGVEMNPNTGRILAYHVYRTHPGDSLMSGIIGSITSPDRLARIPARDILHRINAKRIGSHRGLPVVAPAVIPAADLAALMANHLVQSRNASSVSAILTAANPSEGLDGDIDLTDDLSDYSDLADRIISNGWFQGMVATLPPGVGLDMKTHGQPADMAGFTKVTMSFLAQVLGVPAFLLSEDYGAVNHSGGRIGLTDFENSLTDIRESLRSQVLSPLFKIWIDREVLAGRMDPAIGEACKRLHRVHFKTSPLLNAANVGQAVKADLDLMNAGILSRSEVGRRHGVELQAQLDQRLAEETYAGEIGLDFPEPPEAPKGSMEGLDDE
ncbi:MAG: phage portal protein [Rhodospirillaceae bacterium]